MILHQAEALNVRHLLALDVLPVLCQVVLAFVHDPEEELVDARIFDRSHTLILQRLLIRLDQGEFVHYGALSSRAWRSRRFLVCIYVLQPRTATTPILS